MIRAALMGSVPSSRPFAKVAFGVIAPLSILVLAAAAIGCNDNTPRPSRVTLQSNLGPGEAGSAKCPNKNDADFLVIGQPGAPVDTGSEYNGAPAEVECSVIPESQSFQVAARAALSQAGDLSGSVVIVGTFPSDRSTPIKVSASFTNRYGNFVQQECDVTYTSNNQGVAAGRVWGTLKCPNMVEASKSQECQGTADFKFENCTQ